MASSGSNNNNNQEALVLHRQVSQEIADHSVKTVEDMVRNSLSQVLQGQAALQQHQHQRHNTMVNTDGLTNFATDFKKLVHETTSHDESLTENTETLQVCGNDSRICAATNGVQPVLTSLFLLPLDPLHTLSLCY
jgi:hypothetical protein